MGLKGLAFTSFVWIFLSLPFFEMVASQFKPDPAENNFREFLELRMEGYNSWAREQSLNAPYAVKTPSISMQNFTSTMFTLNLDFTDMTVTNGLISDNAYWDYNDGNILDGTATLTLNVPSVTATGKYTANGILNGTNVSASGTWKMDFALYITYDVDFDVVGGYIYQTNSTVRGYQAKREESINMTMGGLFSGNEDPNVEKMILWRIGQNLVRRLAAEETSLALTEPFNSFLYPQLQQTPISDIIKPQQSLRTEGISIGFNQETSSEPPISKAFRLEVSMLLFTALSIFPLICFTC